MTVKNCSPNDLRFQLVENMAKYPHCYFVSLPIHFTDIFNSLFSYTVFLYVIIPVLHLYLYLYFNYAPTFNSRNMSKLQLLVTDCTSYKVYLQNLLDPDNEADMATVIGLGILTQVYI